MPVVNEITVDRLRDLAATREEPGKVLSIYVNLDPRQFAAPPARETEINSVLDEADRRLRDEARLTHDEQRMLREDLERVRGHLRGSLDAEGARGLALFASGGGQRLEVLKLPRPVEHAVAIGDGPYLEPLARIGARETWWVLLVDRRRARLLEGSLDGLVELWRSEADQMHGQHDQGGWSQARYARSVEKEVEDHLRAVADTVLHRERSNGGIEGLLLGGTHETVPMFEQGLHPDLARKVAGRIEVDVGNSSPDEVLRAAEPVLRGLQQRRIAALLDRLHEGLGTGGRAAAGLADVLQAVHERRVETLLVHEGFTAAGQCCPRCGRLSVDIGGACPVDGVVTEPVGDIVGAAIESTWTQDGAVTVLADPDLEHRGHIAAILRF